MPRSFCFKPMPITQVNHLNLKKMVISTVFPWPIKFKYPAGTTRVKLNGRWCHLKIIISRDVQSAFRAIIISYTMAVSMHAIYLSSHSFIRLLTCITIIVYLVVPINYLKIYSTVYVFYFFHTFVRWSVVLSFVRSFNPSIHPSVRPSEPALVTYWLTFCLKNVGKLIKWGFRG